MMSRFSTLVAVMALLLTVWFGFALVEASRLHTENRDQDILIHAGLPICQAPKANEAGEAVEHMDTKEVA